MTRDAHDNGPYRCARACVPQPIQTTTRRNGKTLAPTPEVATGVAHEYGTAVADSRSEAFGRLFLESGAALRRYVRRLVQSRESADEIVQEAFLRTYEHAQSGRPPGALLYSIAHNLAMDHHRYARRAQAYTWEEVGAPRPVAGGAGESLEAWLLEEERSSLLKAAVEQLAPQCRAAFALRVFHGCSYRDIAGKLSISEKTVEAHVSRGIRETYRYLRRRYQLKEVAADHD
jgi:RNA polymerase sigma-70 factor, ECF subfamily